MAQSIEPELKRLIKERLNNLDSETILDIATEQFTVLWDELMTLSKEDAVTLVLGRLAIERAKVERLEHERNHKPQRG